jgi:hypothetical protein
LNPYRGLSIGVGLRFGGKGFKNLNPYRGLRLRFIRERLGWCIFAVGGLVQQDKAGYGAAECRGGRILLFEFRRGVGRVGRV